MNNDMHLFFAFKIVNEDIYHSPNKLWRWLDSNNNEELADYEDLKILYISTAPYTDAYFSAPPWIYIFPDTNHRGMPNSYAFWNHTNPNGTEILTFETVFPFVSTDPNDLNVSRWDNIGINFEYNIFGAYWPGDRLKPEEWAKLVIR